MWAAQAEGRKEERTHLFDHFFIELTYYREKTVYKTILLNLIEYELYMQRVWGFIPFLHSLF